MRTIPFFLCFLIGFLIHPLIAFIVAWILMFKHKLKDTKVNVCLLIISMFWGILAFTQKSHASIDTDSVRYYQIFSVFINVSPTLALAGMEFEDLVNFAFIPINAILVSLTKNPQSMSFFWVTTSYMFAYLSVRRLMNYYKCYTQQRYTKILLLLTFVFMLFVQISELLKQASAFAVFFYALTIYIEKGFSIKSIVFLIMAIGIHPSMLMVTPLFLYKLIPTKTLLLCAVVLSPLFMAVDVFPLLFSLLPGGGYTEKLTEQYSTYGDGSIASPQYIAIEILMLIMSLNLWIHTRKRRCYETNIIILYFIISFANFGNLIAFLRFALFSHWLFALMIVKYYSTSNFHLTQIAKGVIFLMFLLSLRFTNGRLTGSYRSSYMDNSIIKIATSTSKQYLDIKYNEP